MTIWGLERGLGMRGLGAGEGLRVYERFRILGDTGLRIQRCFEEKRKALGFRARMVLSLRQRIRDQSLGVRGRGAG